MAPRYFYVTVKKDVHRGTDYRVLAGPFFDHESALAQVEPARNAAQADPRAAFYSFGTVSIETKERPPIGILNAQIGIDMAKTTWTEDDLVEATSDGVTVRKGDKGRVIETGEWEYHRVYWPKYKLVAYHLGSQLRALVTIHPDKEETH
jgi:hypothetical protein